MVMVREPHPGGHGWHLHFAVPGFVPVAAIIAAWPHGSVNIQKRARDKSPRKIAGYIAKYVSKGMSVEHCEASEVTPRQPGQHRYWINQGYAVVPVTFDSSRLDVARRWLQARAGEPLYVWDSRDVADWSGPPCLWFDLLGEGLDALPAGTHRWKPPKGHE
jgi:hypothetical protein